MQRARTRSWMPTRMLMAAVWRAGAFALAATRTPFLDGLLIGNSDLLLPAAYMHNLFASPATVLSFQLPRVPSIFPDLLVYGILFAVAPDWQEATLAYASVSFAALILAGGAVVARLSGRAPGEGTSAFLAVTVLAILALYGATGNGYTFTYVFAPAVHSGSFTLSLVCLVLAARGIAVRPVRPGSRWHGPLLAALALAGTLSDRLFVGSFLLPLLAGGGAAWLAADRDRTLGRRALRLAGWAALGCVGGAAADRVLFASLLVREPDLGIAPEVQFAHLPAMLDDPAVRAGVAMGMAAVVLLVRGPRDPGPAFSSPAFSSPAFSSPAFSSPAFWSAAGCVSVAAFLAFLPLVYVDGSSTRYVQPVWWWCLMAVAAALLRAMPRAVAAGLEVAALAAFGLAVAGGARHASRPVLLADGRPPLAACLMDLHDRGLIHAGLAEYWTARPVAAATGWTLQLEQIDSGGNPFVWGNNAFYYRHDLHDPKQPPVFDYIVTKDLDPRILRARFGDPGGIAPCPGAEVWRYPAAPGLGPQLGGAAASAG